MPLYLENIPAVAQSFLDAHAIWQALFAIKFKLAVKPAAPRVAWKQACLHLRPLLPVEHRDVFTDNPRAKWDTMLIAYAELLARSNGNDIDLIRMASAAHILYRFTTHPAREVEEPPLMEVTNFFLMCNYTKLPVKQLYESGDGVGIGLFRFCKFCWRTAIPGRLICYDHASIAVDGSEKVLGALPSEAETPASRRKQASRQKLKFDAAILRLMTKEVMEFHESEFTADVLLPKSGRQQWLVRRRPKVAQLLSGIETEIKDDNIIGLLLKHLHDAEPMHGAWKSTYVLVNTTIAQIPELIWPILVRAESWFLARDETHKNWGGTRGNSGRPKSGEDS